MDTGISRTELRIRVGCAACVSFGLGWAYAGFTPHVVHPKPCAESLVRVDRGETCEPGQLSALFTTGSGNFTTVYLHCTCPNLGIDLETPP